MIRHHDFVSLSHVRIASPRLTATPKYAKCISVNENVFDETGRPDHRRSLGNAAPLACSQES